MAEQEKYAQNKENNSKSIVAPLRNKNTFSIIAVIFHFEIYRLL